VEDGILGMGYGIWDMGYRGWDLGDAVKYGQEEHGRVDK